jgi:hypothetical protein
MSRLLLTSRSESQDTDLFHEAFCKLPGRVRQDPYRSGLVAAELTRALLDLPLTRASEFWLISEEGQAQPLGRIGASLSGASPGFGYLGFFEVEVGTQHSDSSANLLLQAASAWLKAQGCTRVIGPTDLSTWFNYRFQLPSAASPDDPGAFSWEPVNPPEFPAWFESFGMNEAQSYHSQGYSAPGPGHFFPGHEGLKKAHDFAVASGFRFRPMQIHPAEGSEMALLHELSHQVFSEAFLFEPLPLPIFESIYAAAFRKYDFSPSVVIESPRGQAVGFLFAFFDQGHLVVKTMGVLKEFQNLKLSYAVLWPAIALAQSQGIWRGISALVKSGALSERHEIRQEQSGGGRQWRHDYALFEKNL